MEPIPAYERRGRAPGSAARPGTRGRIRWYVQPVRRWTRDGSSAKGSGTRPLGNGAVPGNGRAGEKGGPAANGETG